MIEIVMVGADPEEGKRRQPRGRRRPKPPAGEVPATFAKIICCARSAADADTIAVAEPYWRLLLEQRPSDDFSDQIAMRNTFDCAAPQRLRAQIAAFVHIGAE